MTWTLPSGRVTMLLAALLLAIGLSGPARANSEPIDTDQALIFVDSLGKDILATMKASEESTDERGAKLTDYYFAEVMLANINFRELGRRVLGRMARRSTEAQREEFFPLFATYFINTVIDMLKGVQIDAYKIQGSREMPNKEVVVNVLVRKTDGNTLDTGWRLQNQGGKLSVVDVNVQQASAVGHFRDRMQQGTAQNISGQIARLRQIIGGSDMLNLVLERMGAS